MQTAEAEPAAPAPPAEPEYDIEKRLRLHIGSANIPHPDKVYNARRCC